MRRPVTAFILLALTQCLGLGVSAQSRTSGTLLVLSKQQRTLAIVDTATLHVQAKVPAGNDPHEVVASPDGAVAYVSNYGSGALHTITTVDLVQRKPLGVIDLGSLTGPHGLSYIDGRLWFTAEGAKAIGRYDPSTQQIDLVLRTGQKRTHMIYVMKGEEQVITTNVASGTVSFIDRVRPRLPRRAVSQAIPGGTVQHPVLPTPREPVPSDERPADWKEVVVATGKGPEGFDVSPDGKQVWVANAQDDTVSIVDVASKSVVATIASGVSAANRLKFTPDGGRVLISGLQNPDVVVLDTRTRQVVKRIPTGHGAAGIAIQPDGLRAYVACTPDDYVAVIDLATSKIVGRIAAGNAPDGLAFLPLR